MDAAVALLQRIIINPGHGLGNSDVESYDSGASSCYGKEAEIVRAVADKVLAARLPIDVICTPECGPDCAPNHPRKFDKKKGRVVPVGHLSYLSGQRNAIPPQGWINREAKRDRLGAARTDYILSLHMDAPDDEDPNPESHSGVAVYYAESAGRRRQKEAALVADVIATKLGLPNRGAHADTESHRGYLAILENTDPPALLIELGFVTNRGDVDAVYACGEEAIEAAIAALVEARR